tara:strand:+ start:869 stop:1015 length:147 start_codon:yes stop_codon:yes gene_type:complete
LTNDLLCFARQLKPLMIADKHLEQKIAVGWNIVVVEVVGNIVVVEFEP